MSCIIFDSKDRPIFEATNVSSTLDYFYIYGLLDVIDDLVANNPQTVYKNFTNYANTTLQVSALVTSLFRVVIISNSELTKCFTDIHEMLIRMSLNVFYTSQMSEFAHERMMSIIKKHSI
eukprot:NODE_97_length_21155_cov_0.234850.p19 type:complete len:120 gc:universal NODE_97_length_21155_cov_0.234850:15171-14812(-)